jgi:hypothetical protein
VAVRPYHLAGYAPRDLSNLARRRQRVIAGLEAPAVDMNVVDPEIR